MAPTFRQSFSQIVFKENCQTILKGFADFPAWGNASTVGGGYYRTAGLTNVGVDDASMVNSSTLCVIGVGPWGGALSEGAGRRGCVALAKRRVDRFLTALRF